MPPAAVLPRALRDAVDRDGDRRLAPFEHHIDGWEGTAWIDSNPDALAALEENKRTGYGDYRPIEDFMGMSLDEYIERLRERRSRS